MSGSLKWFIYNANNGDRFAVLVDESNAKANIASNYSSTGRQLFPPIEKPYPKKPPKGFKMRCVNCVGYNNRNRYKRFWVGSRSVWEELLSGEKFISADGELWGVLSGCEEKPSKPFVDVYFDTGLNDGTLSG